MSRGPGKVQQHALAYLAAVPTDDHGVPPWRSLDDITRDRLGSTATAAARESTRRALHRLAETGKIEITRSNRLLARWRPDDARRVSHGRSVFLKGDATALPLRHDSIDAVVTSPPYWGVRDYGHGPDQLGLETRVADYVDHLVEAFEETRRVLRGDGTLWVVIGDTYNTRAKIHPSAQNEGLGHAMPPDSFAKYAARGLARYSHSTGNGLKDKDLVGVPWRFATAMVEAGWYLRAEIIWCKIRWRKPDRAVDRPSRAHETILLFSVLPRYRYQPTPRTQASVWDIDPATGRDFNGPAVMPLEIADRCIRSSTEPGDVVLDPFAGSGVTLAAAARLGRMGLGLDLTARWHKANNQTKRGAADRKAAAMRVTATSPAPEGHAVEYWPTNEPHSAEGDAVLKRRPVEEPAAGESRPAERSVASEPCFAERGVALEPRLAE